MEPTGKNSPASSVSIQISSQPVSTISKRRRIAFTKAMTATLCALVISALSGHSNAQAKTTSSETISDHAGWVQIPGELIRPDCVHEIPQGANVEVANDGHITGDVTLNGALVAHYDPCPENAVITRPRRHTEEATNPPGTGNGWVEASQREVSLASNDNIDFLAGTWTVPSYPSQLGALLYLFNGIEPASGDWILQPVLQYGDGPAGGGNYWAIASWLVGANGYAFHSPLEKVLPGHSIFGYTQMTGVSGNTTYWTVEAHDTTSGVYSWITAHVSAQHWTWAYAGVLEAYNVTACADFPLNGRAVFNHTAVDHGFPHYNSLSQTGWYGAIYSYGGPSCKFMVVAGSESTLDWMQTATF
jgi:hypothetical protein